MQYSSPASRNKSYCNDPNQLEGIIQRTTTSMMDPPTLGAKTMKHLASEEYL